MAERPGCAKQGQGEPELSDFILSPAFLETSAPLASLGLSDARLQADARWPWIVLIPRVAWAREIADLSPADRARLVEEITAAGRAVQAIGEALGRPVEKLNVGLLGNITPQLHAHIVGRRSDDPAWPSPVWGFGEAAAYEPGSLETALTAARRAIS
jgi:diadenosine tetraphosphate (Ap4A) HIT family hydrolase